MSSRQYRKLYESPPTIVIEDSDEEYEPQPRGSRASIRDVIAVSSNSSSSSSSSSDCDSVIEVEIPHGGARKKKANPNKNKNNRNRGARPSAQATNNGPDNQLDEIDRCVMEVNAILGEPTPGPSQTEEIEVEDDQPENVFAVQASKLNINHELKGVFGPEEKAQVTAREKAQPHRKGILRRVLVGPMNDTKIYDFKKTGLSMSILTREGDIIYFIYNHDSYYQKMHTKFLNAFSHNMMLPGLSMEKLDEYKKLMHIEPLLEAVDLLFAMDQHNHANELVENIVVFMQYVAHPSFNLSLPTVRLEYKHRENRPFHVVMLKYLYMLTNKACHHTALEIAKMLYNLDPTDPLALAFVIDTIALRARQYQWLIAATEYIYEKGNKNMLQFNNKYSYALAMFKVANRQSDGLYKANKYLQNAIAEDPQVVVKILELSNVVEPTIIGHPLFTCSQQNSQPDSNIGVLVTIYARNTYPHWRESPVMAWFLKNVRVVVEDYNNSSDETKRQMDKTAMLYFRRWNLEHVRHVTVVQSMSQLLFSTMIASPVKPHSGCSWDPYFDLAEDRYGYTRAATSTTIPHIPPGNLSLFYRFFSSILPNTQLDFPVD